jgi:hypothetical protein
MSGTLFRVAVMRASDLAGLNRRSTQVPVPPRATSCGLGLTSSCTSSSAERLPVCVGVKVTWIVQWAPAGRLLPQLFVCEKSPGLAPPISI